MSIILHRRLFLYIALAIVGVSLACLVFFPLRPGIEFTGGSLLEVQYTALPDKADLETALGNAGVEGFMVRESTTDSGEGYLANLPVVSEEQRVAITTAVTAIGEGGVVTRFTSVGPTIGAELTEKAKWAIGIVLAITIIYVAFAFSGVGAPVSSWVYGFFVTLILAHDILVPMAAMSVFGYFTGAEVDVLFVTALLTILGYSVNDTIVIFDRIREKLKEHRTEHVTLVEVPGGMARKEITYTLTKPFADVVGQAVSETMARSINTSLTVLIALIALYFFGSAVTETFALMLMVGVVAGAYSSIFIASPLLVVYESFMRKRRERQS